MAIGPETDPKLPDTNTPNHRRWFVGASHLEGLMGTLTRLYGGTRFTVDQDPADPDHGRPAGFAVIPHGDDRSSPRLRAFFLARGQVVDRGNRPTDIRIVDQMQANDPDAKGASEREIVRRRAVHHL